MHDHAWVLYGGENYPNFESKITVSYQKHDCQ